MTDTPSTQPDAPLWWQRGIIYQIYPRSFMDANGDGVGDLAGIVQRLDYLEWLGVDAVWISPFYPSPMADFGYDVADYTDVDPLFGTLGDFDRLRDALHQRGIRLILDLVPNHTSSAHPWFLESRRSREDPRRDWYLWADPAPDGGPPNNWLSVFGGGAWEWDDRTRQYYYHAFLKEQPDLNWRNPQVRAAMYDVMRFWLDRGVDGFRVDVMWHMIKDQELRDNPVNPQYTPDRATYEQLLPVFSTDQPEVHDIVHEMRRVTDEYPERVLIGEIYLPIERLVTYYGPELGGVNLPFNFQLVTLPWHAPTIGAAVAAYEGALPAGAWPNWVLGNHDQPRVASRVGAAQARVAAMLLLTLRGTPTLYFGDELGMPDVPIPPHLARDPQQLNMPELQIGRDPERTPMPWDAGPGAGFTTGQPWLPIVEGTTTMSVAAQRDHPGSMLALHRALIALRHAEPALHRGDYRPVYTAGDALAYGREWRGRGFLVALNLGATPAVVRPVTFELRGTVALQTSLGREGERVEDEVRLGPNEGVVVRLD